MPWTAKGRIKDVGQLTGNHFHFLDSQTHRIRTGNIVIIKLICTSSTINKDY